MECPKCKKHFHSLGIASHRANCSRSVDNGHCRHKCSACGKTRVEKFMQKYTREFLGYGTGGISTRYGNQIWFCVDNPDCRHYMKEKYYNY